MGAGRTRIIVGDTLLAAVGGRRIDRWTAIGVEAHARLSEVVTHQFEMQARRAILYVRVGWPAGIARIARVAGTAIGAHQGKESHRSKCGT